MFYLISLHDANSMRVLCIIASLVVISFECPGSKDEYVQANTYLTCKKINNCTPGHEILNCRQPCEPLRCEPCKEGLVQPHLVHWDTRSQRCFKGDQKYSCSTPDIIPRRPDSTDRVITSCPKGSACSCNLDNCFFGDDPCVCNRQFRKCSANMTLHKNGTCVPCPPGHYKNNPGCEACFRSDDSIITTTMPKPTTAKPTTNKPTTIKPMTYRPTSDPINIPSTRGGEDGNPEKKTTTKTHSNVTESATWKNQNKAKREKVSSLSAAQSREEQDGDIPLWVYIVIAALVFTISVAIIIFLQRKFHLFTECRSDAERGDNGVVGQNEDGVPLVYRPNNIQEANGHIPNNGCNRNPNEFDKNNCNFNENDTRLLIDPHENSVGNANGDVNHIGAGANCTGDGAIGGVNNGAAEREKSTDKKTNQMLGPLLEIKRSVNANNERNTSNPASPNHSATSEMGSPVLTPTDSSSLLPGGQGQIQGQGHPGYFQAGTSTHPLPGRQESKTENNKPVTSPSDDSDTCSSSPSSLGDDWKAAHHKTYTSGGTETLPSAAEDTNYKSKSLKPGENEEDTEPKVPVPKSMEDSGIDTSR